MKNEAAWQPSKYEVRKGRLRASRDPMQVGVTSRLITDLIAAKYELNLPRFAKGKLLDLGCGQAPLYCVYQPLVSEVTCVDWKNSMHGNDYLDFEVDLTRDLPFEAEAFDTILLSDVLEHIPTPDDLWIEMARILSPGGSILMNTPFLYWLHEEPHDFYRYTEFALRRFAERSELEVVELSPIGGAPEAITDLTSKNLTRIPGAGGILAGWLQALTTLLLRTGLGQSASSKTEHRFPLGYFMVARKPARTSGVTKGLNRSSSSA